jgi:separase
MEEELREVLRRNKEAVKTASDKENVETFWRERRRVDMELSDILRRANDELQSIQEIFPEGCNEKLYLGVPTVLANFPFESLRCFSRRRVVRAVPVAHMHGNLRGERNVQNGFGVVNPGGDLADTEIAVSSVLKGNLEEAFSLTVGRPIGENQLIDGLERRRHFVYAGHCGGERFFNGTAIQKANVAASVHLFGCRSAEIHRGFATPWHYLIGGAPSVTAVLWDVLGRDCDRVTKKFLTTILREGAEEAIDALGVARGVAKFPALTAAAFIIYQPINLH